MSREIKFRAWSPRAAKNGGEFIGDFVNVRYASDNGELYCPDFRDGYITFQQYTGLKDKNGKEIYEGDIIKNTEAIDTEWVQKVIFEEAAFWREDISKGDDDKWEFDGWESVGEDWQIIGNIYENPELLKD